MHFTSDYDFSPLTAAKQKRIMFCSLFNDFYQTNYRNIYRTDLHQICRVGRTMAVD